MDCKPTIQLSVSKRDAEKIISSLSSCGQYLILDELRRQITKQRETKLWLIVWMEIL